MNLNELVRQLKSVIYNLDHVEVRGHDNMEILLSSIQAISRVAAKLEQGMRELEPPTEKAEVEVKVVSEEDVPAK